MEEKQYFSKVRGLKICRSIGEWKVIEGENRRVGESYIRFGEMSGCPYGTYRTSDPEEIAYLDKRAEEVQDILKFEDWEKLQVPETQRADDAERQLSEANSLIAQLQQQLKDQASGKRTASK